MRVAVIVEYLHARGGTQRQALALAEELQALSHDVHVITGVWNPDACFPEITRNIQVTAVHQVSGPPHAAVPAWRLSKPYRGIRYMGRLLGLPYVLNYRAMRASTDRLRALLESMVSSFDVLNPHDFGSAAWAAAEVGRKHRLPVVWQCNDPLLRWDRPAWSARPLREALVHVDRLRVRSVNYATVLDTRVAKAVAERYKFQPIVVRSGVDIARFRHLPAQTAARRALGLPEDERVALVLTLLNSPHRRVEDAIASHARGPADVRLLLAAPAPDLSGYAGIVAKAIEASPARERITWLRQPLRGETALQELYAASDALIFPNMQQTWGLAAIEAAAAGLPVVISDGAGASEVLCDGDTAVIFRGGDVDDLTKRMETLWADDAARRALGARARAAVQATFSWRRYATDMVQHFTAAMENPAR